MIDTGIAGVCADALRDVLAAIVEHQVGAGHAGMIAFLCRADCCDDGRTAALGPLHGVMTYCAGASADENELPIEVPAQAHAAVGRHAGNAQASTRMKAGIRRQRRDQIRAQCDVLGGGTVQASAALAVVEPYPLALPLGIHIGADLIDDAAAVAVRNDQRALHRISCARATVNVGRIYAGRVQAYAHLTRPGGGCRLLPALEHIGGSPLAGVPDRLHALLRRDSVERQRAAPLTDRSVRLQPIEVDGAPVDLDRIFRCDDPLRARQGDPLELEGAVLGDVPVGPEVTGQADLSLLDLDFTELDPHG